jgi:hypothetical protein
MLGEILAWLPGNAIVHRVALLSKRLRQVSLQLSVLTNDRVVVLKVGK